MPTLFSKIIAGELPGHFVWQDDQVVAFLTIAPLRSGHTLVVPRDEVDRWTDADPGLVLHCTQVAQEIGVAIQRAWQSPRVGLVIAGFEVPHLHVHVFPAWTMSDFDWSRVGSPSQEELAQAADTLRTSLRESGHGDYVPG